ncbi:MAG TPA: hypothetical protein VGC80_17885 [Acetobacteraceae bacterium]
MSETLRLNYFQRQLLGADDFIDEQTYLRSMRRRHNLGPHGWGVITGLQLIEVPREGDAAFRDIILMPGLAVDLFGREILVQAPTALSPSSFAAFAGDQKREVWIGFRELPISNGQAGRMLCVGTDSFSRIEETFQILAGTQNSTLWDINRVALTAGGTPVAPPTPAVAPGVAQLPPDGAFSEQDFEAPGDVVTWLVRLGSVRWDGGVGKFRPVAAQTDLAEGRVWAGLFAASLQSESSALKFAPRMPFADADAQPFADIAGQLSVQGKLTAKKDVEIDGGKLLFDNVNGSDENVPLWVQRRAAAAEGIDQELAVHIGDDTGSRLTRFSVGSGAVTDRPVLAVRADKKVDVPDGKLRLSGNTRRQSIDLSLEKDGKDGAYGIGVQNGAAYARSASDFYWYQGGAHDDAAGAPGTGGSVLLRLDAAGRLMFGAQERQMLNLWNEDYGIGIQDNTLYLRSARQFSWFRGGVHVNAGDNPGPGGVRLMRLDSDGRLFFGEQTDQILNLWSDHYGVGVQNWTLYQRTDGDFCWFRGGTHSDARSDPGAGGVLAMKLDQSSNLSVPGTIGAGGNLFARGQQVPLIDVQTNVVTLNETPGAGNTSRTTVFNLDVTTSLTNYATATVMVGLSDISNVNVATDARWSVVAGAAQRLAANQARFPITCTVTDTDGFLNKFSWIAIFTA